MELYIYMFTYINMRFFCVFCSAERVVSDMAVPPVSPHPCLTTSLWFAWGLLLGSLIRCVCLTPRSLVSCLEVASVPQAAGSSGLHEFMCRTLRSTELLLRAAFGNREKVPLENPLHQCMEGRKFTHADIKKSMSCCRYV